MKTTCATNGRRKKNIADNVYSDPEPCNADFKHDKDVRIAKLYIVADAVCSVSERLSGTDCRAYYRSYY